MADEYHEEDIDKALAKPPRLPWGVIGFAKGVELGIAIAVGAAIVSFLAWLVVACVEYMNH